MNIRDCTMSKPSGVSPQLLKEIREARMRRESGLNPDVTWKPGATEYYEIERAPDDPRGQHVWAKKKPGWLERLYRAFSHPPYECTCGGPGKHPRFNFYDSIVRHQTTDHGWEP